MLVWGKMKIGSLQTAHTVNTEMPNGAGFLVPYHTGPLLTVSARWTHYIGKGQSLDTTSRTWEVPKWVFSGVFLEVLSGVLLGETITTYLQDKFDTACYPSHPPSSDIFQGHREFYLLKMLGNSNL